MSKTDDGESSNSEMIDVNEDEASDASKKEEWKKERALKLGFYPQKEIVYNKLLPYSGDKIKTNIRYMIRMLDLDFR